MNPATRLKQMHAHAADIFKAALVAVDPIACVRRYCRRRGNKLYLADQALDLNRIDRIFVVGAGKASATMALAVEDLLGDRISAGMVNVKYGHTAPLKYIALTEAGHPVPDESGVAGAERILDLTQRATASDLIICLLSGGGSALLPLPASGISLADKQQTTEALLACGATIHEINTMRKHLSKIKGGMLGRAARPAPIYSLILSDVVGDDLDVIASGPTVADPSTFEDCQRIIVKYPIGDLLPPAVGAYLQAGRMGRVPETPKPGESDSVPNHNLIIGSNAIAISAAQKAAEALGYRSLVLSSLIEGETREVARVHGAIAREVLKSRNPLPPPACLLSGGETTVTLLGKGRGGRNQEFALALAMDIAAWDTIAAICAGTDGTDGPTDAAGARVDSQTILRAIAKGLEPAKHLSENNAYPFFERLQDLVVTGPTQTNVMDLRVVLIRDDRDHGKSERKPVH